MLRSTLFHSIRTSFYRHWKILLIVVLALVARCFVLSFGLPDVYLEDEEFFIQPALRVAEHLNSFQGLDPHWYGAPAQTLIYLLAVVFRATNTVVNMIAHTHAPVSINFEYYTTLFVTLGRLIPAIAGTASVFCMYLIGRRFSERAGLVSALVLGASFFFIQHGHIIRPDVLQTFFLLVMLLSVLRIYETPQKLSSYILLGVSFACAITTKYPSLYCAPIILAALYIQIRKHALQVRSWIVGGLAGLFTLFLTGPFLFLNHTEALKAIQSEANAAHAGHDGLSFVGNIAWYLFSVLPWQLGTGFCLVALIGIGYACKQKGRVRTYALLILCTTVFYLCGISTLALHWERWLIPVTTLLMLFVGLGVDWLTRRLSRTLYFSLLILVCLAPAVRTLRTFIAYTEPHTYQSASRFINEHIPPTANVVREPYTPRTQNREDIIIPNASMMPVREYLSKNIEYVFMGAVYQRIHALSELPTPQVEYVRAAHAYAALIDRADVVFALSAFPQACLNAPDWTVLFTFCETPFFGEDQYILRLREAVK